MPPPLEGGALALPMPIKPILTCSVVPRLSYMSTSLVYAARGGHGASMKKITLDFECMGVACTELPPLPRLRASKEGRQATLVSCFFLFFFLSCVRSVDAAKVRAGGREGHT